MPILALARHAQASDRPGLDFDRPLTDKGFAQARAAARFLSQFPLTHVVASPALRTKQTGQAVVDALNDAHAGSPGWEPVSLSFHPGLYEAELDTWLDVIAAIPENAPGAYIVGHNPTVWRAVCTLSEQVLMDYRPSTVAVFDIPRWGVEIPYPAPDVREFLDQG